MVFQIELPLIVVQLHYFVEPRVCEQCMSNCPLIFILGKECDLRFGMNVLAKAILIGFVILDEIVKPEEIIRIEQRMLRVCSGFHMQSQYVLLVDYSIRGQILPTCSLPGCEFQAQLPNRSSRNLLQ